MSVSPPRKAKKQKLLIGRCEWFALPELKVSAIKAKIDTGAKTSSIHAFNISPFRDEEGVLCVHFDICPLQGTLRNKVRCAARVHDHRYIMSSNGQKEKRYIIQTQIQLADRSWKIQLSLSDREPLRYRMLIGREALRRRVLIDPSLSCHQGEMV